MYIEVDSNDIIHIHDSKPIPKKTTFVKKDSKPQLPVPKKIVKKTVKKEVCNPTKLSDY